jgi:hypothetical protein
VPLAATVTLDGARPAQRGARPPSRGHVGQWQMYVRWYYSISMIGVLAVVLVFCAYQVRPRVTVGAAQNEHADFARHRNAFYLVILACFLVPTGSVRVVEDSGLRAA